MFHKSVDAVHDQATGNGHVNGESLLHVGQIILPILANQMPSIK